MTARTTKLVPPAKSGRKCEVSVWFSVNACPVSVVERGTIVTEHTGELVEFQGKCYREEKQLISDRD